MVTTIISGGQTGADQGGLEAAAILGIATGGHMPYGCRTEDGPRRDLAKRFGMIECQEQSYRSRTFLNVRNSDATIRFARTFSSPGEKCTLAAIGHAGKPHLDIDIRKPPPVTEVRAWLIAHNVEVLNIAGNCESRAPGIAKFVTDYLVALLG